MLIITSSHDHHHWNWLGPSDCAQAERETINLHTLHPPAKAAVWCRDKINTLNENHSTVPPPQAQSTRSVALPANGLVGICVPRNLCVSICAGLLPHR